MRVADAIDVATTRVGIYHRVAVSNIFTAISGTGGVFGASKSFLLQYAPHQPRDEATVFLQDDTGNPRAVTVVSPLEGLKHFGYISNYRVYMERNVCASVEGAQSRRRDNLSATTEPQSAKVYCKPCVVTTHPVSNAAKLLTQGRKTRGHFNPACG